MNGLVGTLDETTAGASWKVLVMNPTHLYIRSRGKILGPFSCEQLQLLRERGQLRRFHEVSEDRVTWVTAASLTELFPPDASPRALNTASVLRDADVVPVTMTPPRPEGFQANVGESNSVRDGWNRVRTGLGLILLSNYIWLGGYATFLVGILLLWAVDATEIERFRRGANAIGFDESMEVSVLFLLVMWILSRVAATILQLVGHGFCMWVAPRQNSGVKGLAITVFVLAVTAVVLSILTQMASFVAAFHRNPLMWALTGGTFRLPVYLLDAVAFLLFLLFLRSIAAVLGKKALARNVVIFLASWGGFLASAVVLFFILLTAVLDRRGGIGDQVIWSVVGPFALYVLVILGTIGLALYVWFLVVLHQTRSALGSYLSNSQGDARPLEGY